MNPELSNSFCHACSNLKRTCCVEWALRNPESTRSENYSYKYKADYTLFFRIPLREEARHLLVHLSVGSFFLWTDTIPDEIASLTQEVKYSKVNPLSFKMLIGISPAVALFEGNPSISLTV